MDNKILQCTRILSRYINVVGSEHARVPFIDFHWTCTKFFLFTEFVVTFLQEIFSGNFPPFIFVFFFLSAHVCTKHTAGLNLHFCTLFAHLSSLNSFVSVKNTCGYLWNKSLRLCSSLMFYFRTFMWFPTIFHFEPDQVLLSYRSAGDSFYSAIQESVCKTLSI